MKLLLLNTKIGIYFTLFRTYISIGKWFNARWKFHFNFSKHTLNFWQRFKNRISLLNNGAIPWPIKKNSSANNVSVFVSKIYICFKFHANLGKVSLILKLNIMQHMGNNCTLFVAWQDFFPCFWIFLSQTFLTNQKREWERREPIRTRHNVDMMALRRQ